jgi:cytochrome bd-type quinol oxidase subunit 2
VLRGAGFAFHRIADRRTGRRLAEAAFAVASVLTPFFMGTVVGAVASGRVPIGNVAGDPVTSWLRGAHRGVRALAIAAVVAVIWGWGAAQLPYLLPTTLTIEEGAGASQTLTTVLIVFGVAVVVVLPALALLFTLDQRRLLEEEAEG